MDFLSCKQAAARSLERASYDPHKLALLHTGAALLFSFLLTVLQFFLEHSMASATGLSGIGMRSVLGTAQMLLSSAGMVLLPFWEIGFLRSALQLAKEEDATPATFFEGFRRFAPVMRLFLLQLMLYFGIALLSSQLSTTLYLLSPFSNGLYEAMEPMLSEGDQTILTEAMVSQLLPHLLPIYILFGVVFLTLSIPLFYRFRMAQFVIMDQPGTRARAAMKSSSQMMRGNRLALLRLDLRFWWFYAAQIAIGIVAYLDTILPALGIQLPISANASFFLFYLIHIGLSLLLAWRFGSYVQTTYAHCYLTLNEPVAPAQPIMQNPWN